MKYINEKSEEIELKEILIGIKETKKEIEKKFKPKEYKAKNIYIDNNIIDKIFFI